MAGIRNNIRQRLTTPFRSDPELAPMLSEVNWRSLRRIFFRFIDETPSLRTSNNLAFFSGLGFYSFIDLATISTAYLVVTLIGWLSLGGATLAIKLYIIGLAVVILIGILGAAITIRKHRETSNIQLDTILADHKSELRKRILASLKVE
jgi:hypothetical protein